MEVVTRRLVGKYRELIQYKREHSAQDADALCAVKDNDA